MANLKEIRNRIGSVSSTMQITSAMKMVSAAKLKKAQDSIIAMRPYSIKLTELIKSLTSSNSLDADNILSVKREINEKTDLYFMVVNLFDSEDIVARAPKNGIRTQRPRSYSLGVRYRF